MVMPNMLPITAFLVVALMKAYCTDAPTLCLRTIESIKERASRHGGRGPVQSQKVKLPSYVAVWLWNVARDRSDRPHGERIGPVESPRVDEWSRDCHLRHLAERVAGHRTGGPPAVEPNTVVKHTIPRGFGEDDVLLCQGDSSSATRWLVKSSFGDECPLQLAITRSMAGYLNDNSIPQYSQWFPGKENSVADVLSRDFHLDVAATVSLLHEKFPHELPQSFRLIHLTTAMSSGVGELLRLLPKMQQLPLAPVPSVAAAGVSTSGSSTPSDTATTRSWRDSESRSESRSSPVSQRPCEKGGRTTPASLWDLALSRAGRQAGTIRATLDGVAQAFRTNKLSSPVHDSRG